MKKQNYFVPQVEVLLMHVEQGFSMSGGTGDIEEDPNPDEGDY